MGTSYVQRRTRHIYISSIHTEKKIGPHRISLTKRADPVTLGPNDKLKLTFQVAEEGTDKGVQPHQTFLRFFDSTTGEEGIQPVKVSSSGKAKFELVRCFVTCATWRLTHPRWLRCTFPPPIFALQKRKTSEHGQTSERSPAFRRRATACFPHSRLLRA